MSNTESSNPASSSATAAGQRAAGKASANKASASKGKPSVQRRACAPGKSSRVQMRYGGALSGDAVHEVASEGVSGGGGTLPHLSQIQGSFGRHDVSGVQAHSAPAANAALGSEAYAMGNDIAFTGIPSLHTAAHEAAHVVQQRGGVHLKGGVGEAGDSYEQHADAVADKVVAGESAESLLDTMDGGGGSGGAVQRQAVQFWSGHEHRAMGNMGAMIATGDQNFNVADFIRRHGNRDFTDPAAMGFWGGSQQSTDPVLQDVNQRGSGAVSVRTNDTMVGGGPHGPPPRVVRNSISFGAASEYGGDFDTNVADLGRENSDTDPNGNDYAVIALNAQSNINHFYPLNGAEYRRHHGLALEAAQRGDRRTAVLEEGFAAHFLQDCFAAGHMAPRALDRTNLSSEGEDELGLNRSKIWHDALNALTGPGLPTSRGNFHGDDTMTGSDLGIIATDVGASLKHVLTTLAGNPVAASITIPVPDHSAIMSSDYGPIWGRMMGDYEQDLRDAEGGRTARNLTSDGGTTTPTSSAASDIRNNVFGGTRVRLARLGHTEWNGAILVFNLNVEGRPAPVDTQVWVKWFDQDMGNDHAMSGHLQGTIANDNGGGLNDTDEEIGGPDRINLTEPGIGAARAAADDTNDSYAVFYSDSGCTVPIGRSRTQGNNRGRVDKPCTASGWSWSGATLSFNVRSDGQPVPSKNLYLRWYNEDSSCDRDSRGNLSQTIIDTDSPVGSIQTVRVRNGRARITAQGSANNSGDTYGTVYLDRQCRIPVGKSPLQP